MTTTINKKFTTCEMLPIVKAKLKELKAMYTDNDLLRMFNDATGNFVEGRVLEAVAGGFNSSSYTDKVSASIDMLVYGTFFYHIRFYVDIEDGFLDVDTNELLVTVEEYRRVFK